MDPQATWRLMCEVWIEHDWQQLHDAAEALLNWMNRNGFPPETVPGFRMGSLWNQAVATAVCRFADDLAQQALADPHGIPHGVPFSLSCCECDAEGAATYDESLAEGWTGIEFTPDGLTENFLGLCPDHRLEQE